MKVIFVVDNIEKLSYKINLIKTYFGDNLYFVVNANLVQLFNTFGHSASAIYVNNLAETTHHLLYRLNEDDFVIYYASLMPTNALLNEFTQKIGNKDKIVNVMPNYNVIEKMCNGIYNAYVRSIFKANDSLISPKLQFLPAAFVGELLATHLGNKLFEVKPEFVRTVHVKDKETNKSLKIKTKFNKFNLIPIIAALVITAALVMCLAFFKPHFLLIILFVCLYLADIVLSVIYQCKLYFDSRFLK